MAEHHEVVRKLEVAEAQIRKSREALCSAGYWGDGNLAQLIERALEEAAKREGDEWRRDREKMLSAFSSCWRELPEDEEGELWEAIARLRRRAERPEDEPSKSVEKMRAGLNMLRERLAKYSGNIASDVRRGVSVGNEYIQTSSLCNCFIDCLDEALGNSDGKKLRAALARSNPGDKYPWIKEVTVDDGR